MQHAGAVFVHACMDKHDERDGSIALQRPDERLLAELRALEVPGYDLDIREGDLQRVALLQHTDPLMAVLRAEGQSFLALPVVERVERIDQRTAELGATFVQNTLEHPFDMQTLLGSDPLERLAGLQVVENRIAAIENRSATIILPTQEFVYPSAFIPQGKFMVFDIDQALSPEPSDLLTRMLFHEQTHRMQRAAIDDPRAFPQFSERLIGSWEDNSRPGEYRHAGPLASEFFAYEYQPLERFAFDREYNLMKRMYDYIEKQS